MVADMGNIFQNMYQTQLELKVEHQDQHSSFFNLAKEIHFHFRLCESLICTATSHTIAVILSFLKNGLLKILLKGLYTEN